MPRSLCGVKSLRLLLIASLFANALLFLRLLHASCLRQSPPPSKLSYLPSLVPMDSGRNSTVPSVESRQVIFVGGVPRSGTTLLRAMLDAHPEVYCGEETRVIPRILAMRNRWDHSEKEHQRLEEAGINGDLLDRATRGFISEIILKHGMSSKYLCNKDPLVLNYMHDVMRLYPKSKFILMIRDGRAVAYSIVSRNVTITGVNSKNYQAAANFWNKAMQRMVSDCGRLREKRCLQVYYEKLVLHPREWMVRILDFLGVPWHENVLHHHELINSEIFLSK